MSAINHPALWAALQRSNATEVAEQLFPHMFPRDVVSSAIPSTEAAGTGRHSIRETGPEDRGGFPPADRGPATVGVLYPVKCEERYYDAASKILEDEPQLFSHENCNELGALIQQWIQDARENWEPR